MAVVPNTRLEKVQFYENHIAPFVTNAVAIGISSAEATDLQSKTELARTAYNEHQAAQQSAKVATENFYNAVITMNTAGSALIKKIRAKAEQTGNPNVYTLSEIPAPPTPTPVGPLGQPTNFTVELDNTSGALLLKWKCSNPRGATGTLYQVYRSIDGGATFAPLAGVGDKKITDDTVPAGSEQVQYKIQATRSTSVGPWALCVVNIGSGSASVTQGTPAKLAA
jgi:hypothetical protein